MGTFSSHTKGACYAANIFKGCNSDAVAENQIFGYGVSRKVLDVMKKTVAGGLVEKYDV